MGSLCRQFNGQSHLTHRIINRDTKCFSCHVPETANIFFTARCFLVKQVHTYACLNLKNGG